MTDRVMTQMMEAEKQFHQVAFLASYPHMRAMLQHDASEIAFIGRSNSGKSTLLNRLCGQKRLARTGKTPGVTRAINMFTLNPQQYLVDLPGYGYAKIAHDQAAEIAQHTQDYLQHRQVLSAIVLIVDSRRGLQEVDWQVIALLPPRVSLAIALSKVDKLNRAQINLIHEQCESALRHYPVSFNRKNVFSVSSLPQCSHGVLGLKALRQWLFSLR